MSQHEDGKYPRILYVTRKNDPSKGGMERVSTALFRELSGKSHSIIFRLPDKILPFLIMLPISFIKGLIRSRKIDIIYLQDGMLSPLAYFWRLYGRKTVITIHGLDITYPKLAYQKIIPPMVKKIDGIICVSNATREECIRRGVDGRKIRVIGNGVDFRELSIHDKEAIKDQLEKQFEISLKNRIILLSVGRPIERKGFHWFAEEVMLILLANGCNVSYVVVGEGPLRKRIIEANSRLKKEMDTIFAVGHISDKNLELFYGISDIFIMPNLPIKGDIEGFGIVSLEAALARLPIVANGIEGMKDYLHDGKNSLIMNEIDPNKFAANIMRLISDPELGQRLGKTMQLEVLNERSWSKIGDQYLEFLTEISEERA